MPNQTISSAIPVLKRNLDKIHTVQEWADFMRYSRAHFSVLIKRQFGHSPFKIICDQKYRQIKKLVHENPERKGRVIANATGFKNVKSLYKFLENHYSTHLTAMRRQAKSFL